MNKSNIEAKLKELGHILPPPPPPAATYQGTVIAGTLLFVSGQLPSLEGKMQFVGKVGREFSVEQGQKAAELCAVNILAQVSAALQGDFSRLIRCVRVGGFVNCIDGFGEQPQVINGASVLINAVLGERGHHARAAVGVNALPFNVAVEVDAIFEIS